MHCFRRAASRLQLSNISSSPIGVSTLVSRSKGSAPSISAVAAPRFAYPSAIQTRWNSTDGPQNDPKDGPNIQFVESVSPEGQRPLRRGRYERRDYVRDGPLPKTTLYVGNLFFDVTAEDLRKQFEQFGVVESALIVHDTRGLSKGFGYVTYSTIDEATHAITQQNGGIFEGREVVVNYANTTHKTTRHEVKPTKTLYVGNIPYELTDVDLQEIFEDVQGVTDVRIPVDRRTGLPRGFGHVDFVDQPTASAAQEILSRKAPYGRKLIVNFAKRKILSPEDHARHQEKKLEKRDSELEKQAGEEAHSPVAAEPREPEHKE